MGLKVMVALDENGRYVAYDVSTLEKMKAAYLKLIGAKLYKNRVGYPKEPTLKQELIPTLPEEVQHFARDVWRDYAEKCAHYDDRLDIITAIKNVQSEEEFKDDNFIDDLATRFEVHEDSYDIVYITDPTKGE